MFPFHIHREDRSRVLILAALALVQVLVLLGVAWRLAGGHFMFPLDDAYIHLQYARMLARGFPLVYTDGMAASGGMTSPLFVLLLAPALLVGLSGAKAAFASFLLCAVIWILLPVWTYQLARRMTNQTLGMCAGVLVLTNGHLLWNTMGGMETGLFALMLIGVVLTAQIWWQEERLWARHLLVLLLCLLPLVRPEALLAPLAAIGIVLFRRGQEPRLPLLPLLTALIPFAVWLYILKLGTGDWRPAGLQVKGLSANPYMDWADRFALVGETLSAITTRYFLNLVPDPAWAHFKGVDSLPYLPMGLGFLAFFGAGFTLVSENRTWRPAGGTLLTLLWLGGLLSVAASLFPFAHHQRYLAPWTPLCIVLAMIALRRIGQLFQQLEDLMLKGMAVALVLISLPSLGYWMAEYGRNGRDIYHLLRVGTFALQEERKPQAITDAGVLAFYTNMPVYDLVGLGSREFSKSTLHGPGATLEVLARLPQQQRPASYIGYRSWFDKDFPLMDPVWSVAIPRTSITSGLVLGRHPIDWARIDSGERAPLEPGESLLFALDVASLESETAADYRFEKGPYDFDRAGDILALSPTVSLMTPVTSFRTISTTETITMRSFEPMVDGARIVRGEVYTLTLPDIPKQADLVIRALAVSEGKGIGPSAKELEILVKSQTTGYTARRTIALPDEVGEGTGLLRLPIADVLDEAGGKAPQGPAKWRISVRSAEPPGAAWTSCGYWIIGDGAK